MADRTKRLLDEPDDARGIRCCIAFSYACGGHVLAPWDLYVKGNKPRYFGEPKDSADLYGFVRACAPLLDGYEEAFALLPELRAGGKAVAPSSDASGRSASAAPVAVRGGGGGLAAVVRVRPGDRKAPVVIHLVD